MNRRALLRGAGGAAGVAAVGAAGGVWGRVTAVDSGSRSEREARDLSVAPTGKQGFYGNARVFWSVDTDERAVAITFDDGPDPELTPVLLDTLAAHKVTATFCCMGWNADRHRDLFKRVIDAGHEIGNHGWSHRDLAQYPATTADSEIRRSHELLTKLAGRAPRWYRPPRGELTGSAVRIAGELGCDILLWSFYGDLPGEETPDRVREYVVANLRPGAIVDMHDGIGRGTFHRSNADGKQLLRRRKAELAALSGILSEGLEGGYRFVTASTLATYK